MSLKRRCIYTRQQGVIYQKTMILISGCVQCDYLCKTEYNPAVNVQRLSKIIEEGLIFDNPTQDQLLYVPMTQLQTSQKSPDSVGPLKQGVNNPTEY